MKKRQPIKPNRPTSSLSKQGIYKKDTPAIYQDNPARSRLKYKEKTKTSFLDGWKNFWVFAGPALSLLGFAAYWWPSVAITTGANLDPTQDFQTQFVVTNTGHVPVHEVSFVCALVGDYMSVGYLAAGASLARIETLKPGEAASRGCFAERLSVDGPMLRVDSYYKWPIIGQTVSTRAYFAVKKGPSGAFLVPEAAPSAEPPTLMTSGTPPT